MYKIYIKKLTAFVLLLSILLTIFCSCSNGKTSEYDKDWIIGKTSQEIEEKYGSFDICQNNTKVNNNYCETGCGYLTKEKKRGAFGSSPDEFLMIYFDSFGVAYEIKENYLRPGG